MLIGATSLTQITQKLSLLIIEAWKNRGQILIPHVAGDGFSYHLAKVCGQGEGAPFVEVRLVEAGPAAVYFAALHWAAQNEHHLGVAVGGAAIAVFARGAAEFRHGYD